MQHTTTPLCASSDHGLLKNSSGLHSSCFKEATNHLDVFFFHLDFPLQPPVRARFATSLGCIPVCVVGGACTRSWWPQCQSFCSSYTVWRRVYVMTNYVVVMKSLHFQSILGKKSCKANLLHPGTEVQSICECNVREKCSVRPFQSYLPQIS